MIRTGAPAGARSAPGGQGRLPAPGAGTGAVHLMGAKGAGMQGLETALEWLGYEVSGCDLSSGGHDPRHAKGAVALVRSSAIPPDHPEVIAAARAGLAVMTRAEALGQLLRGRDEITVGIAGAHGKTTITGLTGAGAEAAGLDPLVLVGGRVSRWDGYARTGAGPAVVEADEYDRSFLQLDPALALVSSVEAEHLDTYGSLEAIESAFAEFAGRAAGRLGCVWCADDPGARRIGQLVRERYGAGEAMSYGLAGDAWCRAMLVEPGATDLLRIKWSEGEVSLRSLLPGRHNRQNIAGAFAVLLRLGADPEAAAAGLGGFGGADQRLQTLGRLRHVTIVDDYAHHPTEVAASLAALRETRPGARLTVVFQPHLYTRTTALAGDFGRELEAGADEALVLPVFGAREPPLLGVTSSLISEAAGPSVRTCDRAEALDVVRGAAAGGEHLVVFMGAGDVTDLAREAAAAAAEIEGSGRGPADDSACPDAERRTGACRAHVGA